MTLLPPATIPLYALGPALNVLNGTQRLNSGHGELVEPLELAAALMVLCQT